MRGGYQIKTGDLDPRPDAKLLANQTNCKLKLNLYINCGLYITMSNDMSNPYTPAGALQENTCHMELQNHRQGV